MFFSWGYLKRKQISTALILLVGVLVIGLGILNYFAPMLDISRYQQDIIKRISQSLHRKFAIDGKLFIKLSLKPAIVAQNLTIENPSWCKTPYLLKAGQIEFSIDALDILFGKITIDRLILKQSGINLEQAATGQNNWTFGAQKAAEQPEQKPTTAEPVRLDYVLLDSVRIDYYTPKHDKKFTIGHAFLRRNLRGRYRLDLDSRLGRQKLVVQAYSSRWIEPYALRPLHLQLDTEFGASHLSANVDIQQFAPRLQATVKLTSPQLDIDNLLEQLPAAEPAAADKRKPHKATKSEILQAIAPWLQKIGLLSIDANIDRLVYHHYDLRGLSLQNRLVQDKSGKDGRFSIKTLVRAEKIISKKPSGPQLSGSGAITPHGKVRLALEGRGDSAEQLINNLDIKLQAQNLYSRQAGVYVVKQLALDTDNDKRLRIDGELDYKDVPLRFNAQTGKDFIALLQRQGLANLELRLKRGKSTARLNLTGTNLFQPIPRLHLRLAGDKLAEWSTLAGRKLPLLKHYKLEGRLAFQANGLRGRQFSIKTPASHLKGRFFYRYGKRKTLNIRLDNSRLTLSDLDTTPKPPVAKTKPARQDKADQDDKQKQDVMIIPRTDLMSLLSPSIDVNLEARASDLAFTRVTAKQMDLKIRWQNKVFAVQVNRGRVSDGALMVDVYLTVLDNEAAGKIEMHIKQMDYGKLMQELGLGDKMQGKADVSVNLVGFGRDLKAFLTDSDGIAEFIGEKGILASKYLRLWGGDIVEQILPFSWFGSEQSKLNCVVGRFDLTDGRLSSDSLLLDTENVTVAGTGAVDLNTERLAFELMPDPKNISLISLATPVKIRGTLAQPRVEPHTLGTTWTIGSLLAGLANPAILITRFAKLGSLGENPCLEAIGKKQGEEQKSSILKAFKDTIKFIQRPLDKVPDID